jgi:hypothetical protein
MSTIEFSLSNSIFIDRIRCSLIEFDKPQSNSMFIDLIRSNAINHNLIQLILIECDMVLQMSFRFQKFVDFPCVQFSLTLDIYVIFHCDAESPLA